MGTALESHSLRRDFCRVTKAAEIGGRWVPEDLRTSFVSIMSHQGVSVEEIARLAGLPVQGPPRSSTGGN
jgi:hypothetical protein